MSMKKVKPIEGMKVLNPATNLHISEDGTDVVWSTYWKRRLNDGEIEIIEPEKPVKKATKKSNKKSSEVE